MNHRDRASLPVQWLMIRTRLEVLEAMIDDPIQEESQLIGLSNQIDELVMLLANFGIELRQAYHQSQQPIQSESGEELEWLEQLLKRTQS